MSFRDLAVFALVWSYVPDGGGIPVLTAAYALVPTLSCPAAGSTAADEGKVIDGPA